MYWCYLNTYLIKQEKEQEYFCVECCLSPNQVFWAGITVDIITFLCYSLLSLFIWENPLQDNVKFPPGLTLSDDICPHCSKLNISGQEQNELIEEDSKILKISESSLSEMMI